MLKILDQNTQADYLRKSKANLMFGIKIGKFDIPMPIYNAYVSPITSLLYFYARELNGSFKIINTFELSTSLFNVQDGQFYIIATQYDIGGNGLTDGLYFYEFATATQVFKSELFRVDEYRLTGNENKVSSLKQFSDDPIFEFSDI